MAMLAISLCRHVFSCARAVGAAKKVTRRQLDSAFGYLSYCSGVVYGGRAILHGLRCLRYRDGDAAVGPVPGHHNFRVSAALRADMEWWVQNLERFNGDRRAKIVSQLAEHRMVGIQLDERGGRR